MTTNEKAMKKITLARNTMICTDPFFATLALKLIIAEDNTIETMATDGVMLLYNAKFVNSISQDELTGVIIHEVLHCSNLHHIRKGHRDDYKWNIACDYVVNLIVRDAKYKLPLGCLYNIEFRDMSAEEVYNKLEDKDMPKQQPAGIVCDFGTLGGDGMKSEAEKAEHAQEWTESVIQAHKIAKAMGQHLCKSIEIMVGDIAEPQIPWRDVLSRFVQTEVTRNDYSWLTPNRRYLNHGFVLPSLHSKTIGKVWVAVDTSGSVTLDQIKEMVGEVVGILEMYEDTINGVEVLIIYCDNEVKKTETVTLGDNVHPAGGGGTDYVPVFDYINKEDERPAALIYMTDGECNSFPHENDVDVPVLWLLTKNSREFRPPFGEIAKLRNE